MEAPGSPRRSMHIEPLVWLLAIGGGGVASFLSSDAPWGRAALGLTTVLVLALVVRSWLWMRLSRESLGLVAVSGAAVALVMLVLPARPARPVVIGELSPLELVLILTGMLFLVGVAMYGVALRHGESSGGLLRRHGPTLAVVVLVTVIVQLARRAGFGPWLLYLLWAILGLWLVMLVLCLPVLYFYLRRSPVNRLAGLVERRRYEEAIRLGQSLPEKHRTPLVLFNLAVAYRLARRVEESRAILEELQRRPQLPAGMAEAIAKQLTHLNSSLPRE